MSFDVFLFDLGAFQSSNIVHFSIHMWCNSKTGTEIYAIPFDSKTRRSVEIVREKKSNQYVTEDNLDNYLNILYNQDFKENALPFAHKKIHG